MSRSNDDWDELSERTPQRRKTRKKHNKRPMSLDDKADADFDERHASKFVEDLAGKNSSFNCRIIKLNDQNKTDLQKSLDWCIDNGIKGLSLIGFSGGDDDHWMAALWTLINYYEKLNLLFYSNTATIFCVNGEQTIETISGQTISIIPSKDETRITLKNLKYSFKDQKLYPPSFGIRNLALGSSFFIKTTKPVWIFLSYH